jgi:hypothetical protein
MFKATENGERIENKGTRREESKKQKIRVRKQRVKSLIHHREKGLFPVLFFNGHQRRCDLDQSLKR